MTSSALITRQYSLPKKLKTTKIFITGTTHFQLFLVCFYLFAVSIASLFGGGTVKHTDGTMASLPLGLMTFHLARWELLANTHSSSL